MCKSFATITAALAIVCLGTLVSDRAQAGGSASASTKYNAAIIAAGSQSQQPLQTQPRAQASRIAITSFSSSSAKGTLPRR
jgi:hypothetical protein